MVRFAILSFVWRGSLAFDALVAGLWVFSIQHPAAAAAVAFSCIIIIILLLLLLLLLLPVTRLVNKPLLRLRLLCDTVKWCMNSF